MLILKPIWRTFEGWLRSICAITEIAPVTDYQHPYLDRLFVRTLRGKEIKKDRFCPSGASYVLAAAVLCVLCFPKEAAVVAMTVMLVSDSCAAVFGKIWGTRRLRNRKSLEGTATAISLPCMFSHINRRDFDAVDAKYTQNLPDLLQTAGYQVLWRDDNCFAYHGQPRADLF